MIGLGDGGSGGDGPAVGNRVIFIGDGASGGTGRAAGGSSGRARRGDGPAEASWIDAGKGDGLGTGSAGLPGAPDPDPARVAAGSEVRDDDEAEP